MVTECADTDADREQKWSWERGPFSLVTSIFSGKQEGRMLAESEGWGEVVRDLRI